jgi:hypothetical protein
MGNVARDPAVRYREKVDRRGPDDCWPWTGTVVRDKYGRAYGQLRLPDGHVMATRFGWELEHGEPLPRGVQVCHTCDVELCQNPRHWFSGTAKDNADDRDRKGRHGPGRTGSGRLSDKAVRAIRAAYAAGFPTQRELATQHGISQAWVSKIGRRVYYAHVTDSS